MNDQSTDRSAWVWYEPDTLALRHVGFNENSWSDPHLDKMQIELGTALDIASGKSRLYEYAIIKADDELTFVYVKQQQPFKKFWQLLDPVADLSSTRFDDSANAASPIKIKQQTENSIILDVTGKAKNIELYLTMKNDPNYLIDKIDLFPYAMQSASVSDIEIPVSIQGDYSVYVRYNAS